MSEDRFDELLRKAAHDYNNPPETPREEMWTRIEERRIAHRRASLNVPFRGRWQPRWIAWPLAAAAAMILVFVVLKDVNHTGDLPTFAEAPQGSMLKEQKTGQPGLERGDTAQLYRLAAEAFFARTDAVLTQFRSEGATGRDAERIASWAKGLLTETRLLMDSPAARDTELKLLLEDLEFVLAQIAQFDPSGPDQEREVRERRWIQQGVNNKDLLMRLRKQTPAGKGLVGV